MSAAAAWDVAPLDARPRRPALRLVPTGRDLGLARPAVRISRFGRLMLTIGTAALATFLAVAVLGIGSAGASIDHRVSVQSGQTLSDVAAAELPQVSVAEGVAQIQLANDLSTSQVHAGQELAIPAIR